VTRSKDLFDPPVTKDSIADYILSGKRREAVSNRPNRKVVKNELKTLPHVARQPVKLPPNLSERAYEVFARFAASLPGNSTLIPGYVVERVEAENPLLVKRLLEAGVIQRSGRLGLKIADEYLPSR
jgi:hypothetical protein